MPADPSTQFSLTQLFDALPDGVLYFRPVCDVTDRHIIDFVVDYANLTIRENGPNWHQAVVGTSVRHDSRYDAATTEHIVNRLKAVVESGQADEFEHYNQLSSEWLSITCTKAGDGVLAIARVSAGDRRQALEQAAADHKVQADLYDGVLTASINGIITYQAVRDRIGQSAGAGTILDFRSLTVNPVARQVLNLPDTVPGWLLLDRFPAVREYGLFDEYVRTVETGMPMRFETSYEADGVSGWYDVAVVKLGDGFVITFNDITVAKHGQQAIEQNRADLQAVIDSSQTGIVVLSAVLDAGAVVDFRYKTANRMVTALVGQTPAVITGTLVSDWFASYFDTPTFGHYKHTFETGEDQRFEIHYAVDGLDVWADIKSVKFGDDVLITINNYTDLKRTQLVVEKVSADYERQASLLSSILDSSNSGIIAFESIRNEQGAIVDFRFVTINEACEEIIGVPLETMRGNTLLTLFPGNVETGLFALYVNTTETGEPGRTETYYNRDGLDFWLDISARQLGDGFVVTFTDISVVKRAAKDVEQSAAKLQTVIDSSQTGIFLLAPLYDDGGSITDFTYRSLNQTVANYVGQTPAGMVGTPVSRWFPTYKTTDPNFDRYCEVFETGQPQRFEVHYDGDGLYVWLDLSVVRISDEILVTFLDYTPLKKLQKELESSAAELQTVINTSQTGIFLFSPIRDDTGEVVDFRFRMANRMLTSYIGQEPEAVIGALGSRWFPDYKTNGLFDAYRKTYLTGESLRFDIHYEGSRIDVWLDIMATKMGDEVLVTFGDYTALKKLQQQLESSVVDLQRSNANLEQFAYVASHDLQEPLRKIQSFGDIIETQYGAVIGEQGADMIRRMQSAAARMQVLIKDVLAYSRIATKRDTIKPVALSELVASVVDDLETAIADHQATVIVDPLPTVTGDASQLRQLFQNLLSNALKFTKQGHSPGGGTRGSAHRKAIIVVTTRLVRGRDAGTIVPPGDADRLFHLIEVIDNGIGFEPHQAERIFQVFQRLHGRSNYKGTGIGLAIVKKVVENHSGYIQAVGRPGEGATFRVWLPV